MDHKHVYLAGPMRGHERFNFDAFESAASQLENKGIKVTSPHRMDLEIGFDPNNTSLEGFDVHDCVRRDVEAIISTEACVFLPGWENSIGAKAEKAIADWLDRPCFSFPDLSSIAA